MLQGLMRRYFRHDDRITIGTYPQQGYDQYENLTNHCIKKHNVMILLNNKSW